ncbi:MAG: hypothetical protein KF871_12450 [Hydrogenophaga sp.]|uniref:hypothetical protein n=1 Tax=Hydrogenophaga sp. TaxID=1904254 RepID=UPI001DD6FBC2|nr:hypothetical protein [Hydrogenophaga sp.]MBX3610696.1 hypothetical protein [Hydrogenophaga sp.]
MDTQTVFVKTDQGREALTSRPPGLGPRLRSLLIMVDGKRTVGDLDKLLGGEGASLPLLESLAEQGWVTAMVVSTPEAFSAPVDQRVIETLPPPLAEDLLPFGEARRLVARFINDQLGPMGETLAIKVEGCKNPGDLQALLPRIRDVLLNMKNTAAAAQFDVDVAPRLPLV